MKISCEDRERIFLDGTPEEWALLEQHATACEGCAVEVHGWRELSMAAAEMREHHDDPALWSRIEAALAEQRLKETSGRKPWGFSFAGWRLPLVWQTALACALVVAILVGGAYLYIEQRPRGNPDNAGRNSKSPFLNDRTLGEVERTETAYMQAIDKLAAEAKPEMTSSASPLMDSYREKLLVLDSAIAELRAQAGENPSNAHLRYQLLAMYREKQDTLQEILEIKR